MSTDRPSEAAGPSGVPGPSDGPGPAHEGGPPGRRRALVARLVLVLAVAGAAWLFSTRSRSERTLVYDLGDDHAQVVRLRVSFHQGNTLLRRSVWNFDPGEAPRRVRHTPVLVPGEVEASFRIDTADGAQRRERRLIGEGEGELVLHLGR